MNLNSILESISKEQTKPRLKERPLSESEVINAYSTIASERYAILTEYSNIRINAMRSYSESDEDVKDAEPYDPDPEATNRAKQKSVSGQVWDIIKKAVKALITILKSLVQKVLNLFKKRQQPMEDAIEVEIQTYNEIKETLLLEYIPNNETERINQVISKTCGIVREGLPYKGPMLIDGVLFRVVRLLKDQERFKDIKIDYQLVPQKAWIEANEVQIEQVLFHLLTNAAQALKEIDQQEKIIRIFVQVTDQVILSVVDNGPGLQQATLDKIFEPFFTTGRTAENMGLGLAIVQSIIYAYGGEIVAENNLGGGATFRVSFPLIKGLRA